MNPRPTKFWDLAVGESNGAKYLDLTIAGVIDGGWLDEVNTSSAEIIKALADHPDAARITVRINSTGGSLFGGIAIYNALEGHGAKVTTHVNGIAASAASLIAMAGRTVMGRGAMLMIHDPWTLAAGNADELRRVANMLDKASASLISIYEAKTGASRADLSAMVSAETWLTAEEAVAKGFADEVTPAPSQVEARGDMVVWNSVVFPRQAMPPQILSALPRPAPAPAPLTRADLAERAPGLLAELLAEGVDEARAEGEADGRAAGAAAERARLQAIDDLDLRGVDDLVVAAKYGDKPQTAEQLAVAVLKASKAAGAEFLAARVAESRVAAGVGAPAPEQNHETAEQIGKSIGALANARNRGGHVR